MANTSQYNIDAVTRGVSGWGNGIAKTIYTSTIGAASDTTLTVPSSTSMGFGGANVNKFIARIRCTGTTPIWFAVNGTAAVPAGNTFAASTSELLIQASGGDNGYYVRAGDVLHFFSAAAANISVAFYAIQSN